MDTFCGFCGSRISHLPLSVLEASAKKDHNDALAALRERADRLEGALRNLLDSMGGPVLSDPRLSYETWQVDAGAVDEARAALKKYAARDEGGSP